MSEDWQSWVRQAHIAFGQVHNDKPTHVDDKTYFLRMKLMEEELGELDEAMRDKDMEAIADACADLIYVTLGTAVSHGIDLSPIFRLVHLANMAKVGGGKRADGKMLKPPGWTPPCHKKALLQQGWDGR
jgi:predicted HAD superfamily Cof-like phosphohydrolase